MRLYRLYIDESGDHTYYDLQSPGRRYLCLTGCIIEKNYYRTQFIQNIQELKDKHFPREDPDLDPPVILHRSDIINRKGPFWRLRDEDCRIAFDGDLLEFFESMQYVVISVVIDKQAHIERYGKAAYHPYHYCLIALLERYCGFLNTYNARGDVMAESRRRREDDQLKSAYCAVYQSGSQWRGTDFFQKTLTSKHIKIKEKSSNIEGLQLADLLAHPSKQEILSEDKRIEWRDDVFGKKICEIISQKYNKQIKKGRIQGYGKVFIK